MQIRQKITLWISLTALLAAASFSSFVFIEMAEAPQRLIDAELQHMAEALLREGEASRQPGRWRVRTARLPYPPERYWILATSNGEVRYASSMTRFLDIPALAGRVSYTVDLTVPRERIQLGQDEHDGVVFRVRLLQAQLHGRPVSVRIAKPVEELEEEFLELLREVGAALATCTLLLVLFSYLLAGRILRPVASITRLAREINAKTLDQRIPVGESRDELGELSRTLNRMFDRLQLSFRRQKEFLANASHELKSPLSLLMLSQEEMLQEPSLPVPLRENLERQLASLRRLSRLVKDLLDLSRLELQGGAERRPVALAGLVAGVLDDYRELAAARGVALMSELAPGVTVAGDAEQLRRLLINLVDNGIRYNLDTGGRVRIRAGLREGWLRLTVANTGIGVPAAERERVFEQFYRLEKSRSVNHGGSGLGLTIARKIVELHGGRISLASESGGWTEVTVELPAG